MRDGVCCGRYRPNGRRAIRRCRNLNECQCEHEVEHGFLRAPLGQTTYPPGGRLVFYSSGADVARPPCGGWPVTLKRIVGFVLVVIGLVSLLFGGISWKREKTVVDLGP